MERFEPWYVDLADRPVILSAPATIAHNQPFTATLQLAAGTTLQHLRVFRPMSTSTSSMRPRATSRSAR